ncbi:hypothetical protein, partial [Streptomyces sp. NPDC059639]|uniref:hypothetical protein n=1 Tax=Streptomyces sp. NPDC059639 TaxID=3346891 RepID=UPI003699371B
ATPSTTAAGRWPLLAQFPAPLKRAKLALRGAGNCAISHDESRARPRTPRTPIPVPPEGATR